MGRSRTQTRRRPAGAPGVTLDAGALTALERGNEALAALLERLAVDEVPVALPAAALAQVWRASARQHRIAVLLAGDDIDVAPLDLAQALAIGALLGSTRTDDAVDASVVVTARSRGDAVVTSDAEDLRHLDPPLRLIAV